MQTNFRKLARTCLFILTATAGLAQTCSAQGPQAGPEHELLKKDVGTWKAEIKTWMGADGQPDESSPPQVSNGMEKNRMLGSFWCLSDFEGMFGDMEFRGHAVTGYDPKLKKYVGSWVDSLSPSAMHMTGTYDAASQTMTYATQGVGIDGQATTGKMEVKYWDDDHHTMTMYDSVDGKLVRTMQVDYTRVK